MFSSVIDNCSIWNQLWDYLKSLWKYCGGLWFELRSNFTSCVIFLFNVYRLTKEDSCTELELASVRAMSAVVCCGPVFDSNGLNDDVYIYHLIIFLLNVYRLTKEDSCTELELVSVRAMLAVVCCGPVFDSKGLNDECYYYHFITLKAPRKKMHLKMSSAEVVCCK